MTCIGTEFARCALSRLYSRVEVNHQTGLYWFQRLGLFPPCLPRLWSSVAGDDLHSDTRWQSLQTSVRLTVTAASTTTTAHFSRQCSIVGGYSAVMRPPLFLELSLNCAHNLGP